MLLMITPGQNTRLGQARILVYRVTYIQKTSFTPHPVPVKGMEGEREAGGSAW